MRSLFALLGAGLVGTMAGACTVEAPDDIDPLASGAEGAPRAGSGDAGSSKKDGGDARRDPAPPAPAPTAPLAEAISFARATIDGTVHLLAVVKDDGVAIDTVDIGEALGEAPRYPLDLVTKHGFAKVAGAIATAKPRTVSRASLLPPIAEGTAQVCAAENYEAHQAETDAAPTPFLFPKIVQPTGENVEVARQKGDLLDYEVELCVAFGKDIASASDLTGTTVGYVLCNDLSERATQVLNLDPNDQASGKGFTDAKSRAGFLPLGPYVVVPKDPDAFIAKIRLKLSVDGKPRQDDTTKSMIWKVPEIVKQALAVGDTPRFSLAGKPRALLPDKKIAKGMLVVSGTPGGVNLKAPGLDFKAIKAAEYYAGFVFLQGKTLEKYVQEQYVEELRKGGAFLAPGNVIEAEGTMLGRQRITVTGSKE